MEAVGLALSAVQTLCASLQCSELKELFSFLGYKSELESLQTSVVAIQSMLKDADNKQAHGLKLSAVEQNFIEKIKDVVYDADDLLDEYATKARRQQLRMERGNKFFREVRRLYSLFENLRDDYLKSPEVKKTAKKLAEIAGDASNFKIDCPPIKMIREETCSHVNENLIIGRWDDKKTIVDLLLDPKMQGDLPVLTIVGMGGLGKTTLAQLVYNDPRIQKEFPLKLWVCVSDQDQNQFDVKAILIAIYESATPEKYTGGLALDQVVQGLGSKLNQNKYLLVFDDLWNEKRDECHKLVDILIRLVQRGSRILVTTRSKRTANAIGSSQPYELQGLSDENSWHLFEMNVGREKANSSEFIEMGKDIVKQCANVPLAIKVVGSLLYNQNENTWCFLQQSIYTYLPGTNEDNDNKIMSILKFSYYHLSPSLKSCLTYCALFPKDFRIEKNKLISLWIAQGYVEKSNGVQTMEEIGEEYFQILVQRCFFEDLEQSGYDFKVTFKIHDLMHDIAQQVAGKEIFVADSVTTGLDKKIRHLYDDAPNTRTKGFITSSKIRTYVQNAPVVLKEYVDQFPIGTLIAKWRRLWALDLTNRRLESLPDSIGKLLHLRYLNLYANYRLRMLPKSITELINLETLILAGCASLIELPKDLNRLVKLRALKVSDDGHKGWCVLSYMPRMEKLTCLNSLNGFIVAKRKSNLKQDLGGLEDLRALGKLRGTLKIWISDNYKHAKENGGGGYLSNNEHLNCICILFAHQDIERKDDVGIAGSNEDLLEDLKPHDKLKVLTVKRYHGVRIPSWAIEDNLAKFLPNLVKIVLVEFHGLQSLPWFGKLRFLKILVVVRFKNLEYMESGTNSNNSYGAAAEISSSLFFPSLEQLLLCDLPKLKGWWRESSMTSLSGSGSSSGTGDDEIVNWNNNNSMQTAGGGHRLPSFPRLSKLFIQRCPNMVSIPRCPTVEHLTLKNFNKRLEIIVEEEQEQNVVGMSNDSQNLTSHSAKIREIETNNLTYLNSLPLVAFDCVTRMDICGDREVESLTEVEEVFRSCSSSLRSLTIMSCPNLSSVSRGLKYLTTLESLELSGLRELRFDETEQEEEEEEGAATPWKCLGQSLRSLELAYLCRVVELPKGLRYLIALQSLQIRELPVKNLQEWIGCMSSLQSLTISACDYLESMPEALRNLTSLTRLELHYCGQIIHERCKNPDGEDWPKIQHIPYIISVEPPHR